MKKNILLMILLLVFNNLYAGTVYYANSSRPDDTGDGLSWATAKKTLDAFDAILVSHDTVVCKGIFGAWTIDTRYRGYGGNYTVFIDSFRYVNGFDIDDPDTVWSATINNTVTFDTVDRGIKLIGFYFSNLASWSIYYNSGCDDNWLIQCKLNCPISDPPIYTYYADSIRVVSCLFLGSANNRYGAIQSIAGIFTNIINCTFYGFFAKSINYGYIIDFNTTGTSYKSVVVNNLFIQTDSDGTYSRIIQARTGISDWNNNIYYCRVRGSSPASCWYIEGSGYNTIATWRIALQAYDADGETNSLYLNPGVRDTLTTCYITKSSPAHNAGRNMGYGTSIGYYQNADYGVYYVNSSKANDNGKGYSWATAKQTIPSLRSQIGSGDTVVCKGTWTLALNISGNTYPIGDISNYITFIDSVRYSKLGGFNEEYPDTVYSAKIYSSASYGLNLNIQYYKFLGFYFECGDELCPAVKLSDFGDYAIIHNCKIYSWSPTPYNQGINLDNGNIYSKFISCLIISNIGTCIYIFDDNSYFYNCTIIKKGIYNSANHNNLYINSSTSPPVFFVNNIFYDADDNLVTPKLVYYPTQATTTEWDYNLYYAPLKVSGFWSYGATVCNTFGAWKNEIQKELVTAENHSYYANPLFLETNNYAIDATSPGWGTGTDLGYGTNIGYYQGSGTIIKKGFKSRVIIN